MGSGSYFLFYFLFYFFDVYYSRCDEASGESDSRNLPYLREKSESVDETLGKLNAAASQSGDALLARHCPLLSAQQQQDLSTAAPLHLDHIDSAATPGLQEKTPSNGDDSNIGDKNGVAHGSAANPSSRPAIPASTSDSSIATILQELFAERKSRSSSLKDGQINPKHPQLQQQQQQQEQHRNRHQNKRYRWSYRNKAS